jgi:hypothetical protein
MRTQQARELAGVGEDGGAGRGDMRPIPSTKSVGRHNNNDDKKNNNQLMMVAVGWGRMQWVKRNWASEAWGEVEDGGGGGSTTKPKPMGDVMREAEKEERMDRGDRGNNDNANNNC